MTSLNEEAERLDIKARVRWTSDLSYTQVSTCSCSFCQSLFIHPSSSLLEPLSHAALAVPADIHLPIVHIHKFTSHQHQPFPSTILKFLLMLLGVLAALHHPTLLSLYPPIHPPIDALIQPSTRSSVCPSIHRPILASNPIKALAPNHVVIHTRFFSFQPVSMYWLIYCLLFS